MTSPLNIVFMGTPQFAVPALEALINAGHKIVAVYSQPPRPAGRGQKIQASPVQLLAEKNALPVFTPKTLKTADAQKEFASHGADVAVVAAYGLILPKPVLDTPRYGCINIHASLLPRWRGASPIQHAIWKGDTQSGITIMQMDAGLDTGAMLKKTSIEITPTTTCTQLHDALSGIGGPLIVDVLATIDTIKPEPQDETKTCYAPMLKKEDGRINWANTAQDIDRQIRALNPWPGTYTQCADKRIKILESKLAEGSDMEQTPAKLQTRFGHIKCGDGRLLRITKIQPEGARAMDVGSAINGGYISIGDVFS